MHDNINNLALTALEFERPIVELEAKIQALRELQVDSPSEINLQEDIENLEKKQRQLIETIFNNLTPIQIVQLARHPQRPHTLDYINSLMPNFDELFGDRFYGKGESIVGGLAYFEEIAVMVLGHEKGRNTKEKIARNFGMPSPEDYRKSLRLFLLAEKFNLPIINFIDTIGAYPGIRAEEQNQSGAIAQNLLTLAKLKTPVISIVIGEGGSGGALALGLADKVLMLENSYYSVITPEGAASILRKSVDKSAVAEMAKALCVTAPQLLKLGLIDHIIPEPLGGAHRDYTTTLNNLKSVLYKELSQLITKPLDTLVRQRQQRFLKLPANYINN